MNMIGYRPNSDFIARVFVSCFSFRLGVQRRREAELEFPFLSFPPV